MAVDTYASRDNYDEIDPAIWRDLPLAQPDLFWTELMELHKLHTLKQADYGRDADPFANLRSSSEFGLPAWLGVAVRMNDKMHRLKSYAQNGKLANEGVVDTFRDLAAYAVMGKILWDGEQPRDGEQK